MQAVKVGYQAIAITDHDGLYGAYEFGAVAKSVGIQPITGAEMTLADGSHITLLAESRTGYGNLSKLITVTKHGRLIAPALADTAEEQANWFTVSMADYAEGLILLTGCRQGQLSRLLDAGRYLEAQMVLATYVEWFGRDNVFVEMQHNLVAGDRRRIRGLVALAESVGVRYVATGNVHYHHPERAYLQDVLIAISKNSTLDATHRDRRPNREFYLRDPREQARIWKRYPEAIRSTELIRARCAAFDITADLGYEFPAFVGKHGETSDEALARICSLAFRERYPDKTDFHDRAAEQLNEELRLISKHRLSGFFLIYKDLLDMAREVASDLRGGPGGSSRAFLPPGRGRGSAVSSIVCYLIGLSPVDPLRHNLFLGRFLNDEMTSVPDIDIDFPREIREEMILRVFERYGHDHAAMVCAFSTFRLKSAVRDVGKALGLPNDELDRIAKVSESRGASGIVEELGRIPEYVERSKTPPWSYLIALSTQIAGFPRHITQHSGGMVISSTPLTEIVPIQPAAMEGRFICQWDKDSINETGIIKVDFLALGMLSLVEECLDHIDARGGTPVDLSRINYDDPVVYKMIQDGDTIGTFQIESRAQIQMIRKTKPESLADLVVQVAIVRPGPIVGGAVTPFVERRTNPDYIPTYDHPLLEPVLKETLGVVLYQEQVIQVAQAIAGFTAGQADQLRRAMTKKRSLEAMQAMRDAFMAGAEKRGVSEAVAADMFHKIAGFAQYGFPKSHAAAFALLAYQSSWLKQYYPAEFLTALLNNQPMGFYTPAILINDARRHGLRVLRPDVNLSDVECTVEGPRSLRIGLWLIRGLSEISAKQIVAERVAKGPYRSLIDLIRRVPLRAEAQEALISSSACDGFGLQRREMLWQRGLVISPRKFGGGRKSRRETGQQLSLALPTAQDSADLPPTTTWQRIVDSYRTLGFSLLPHPVSFLRQQLPSGMVTSKDLETLPDRMPVTIVGLVAVRQRPETAKGITFMLLEDEDGLINAIIYPDLYERRRYQVRSTPFVVINGRLQRDADNINIIATDIEAIDDTTNTFAEADGQVPWSEGDSRVHEDADWRLLSFDRDDEGPRRISRADLRSVKTKAHSYR